MCQTQAGATRKLCLKSSPGFLRVLPRSSLIRLGHKSRALIDPIQVHRLLVFSNFVRIPALRRADTLDRKRVSHKKKPMQAVQNPLFLPRNSRVIILRTTRAVSTILLHAFHIYYHLSFSSYIFTFVIPLSLSIDSSVSWSLACRTRPCILAVRTMKHAHFASPSV